MYNSHQELKRRRQQLKEDKMRSHHTSSSGPRIKHVSRRASVALGYSPARFIVEEGGGGGGDDEEGLSCRLQEMQRDFALSALSANEKRKILEPNNETGKP